MALAAAPDLPGFRAPAPLGFGPTSTIYGAQSLELGRWVALILYSITLPDERSQRRFRRGYEVGRRLGAHPHAATVLDTGLTSDRRPFIAAEIYERGTLEGRIQGRQYLSVSELLHMGICLAGALETAHRAEVIHGGVHPGRILLAADGEPALADLGVVPLVDRAGLAALIGPTTHHAPPELLEGEPLGTASDVYSLASTLYTGLTGRPPYAGSSNEDDSTPALLVRILQHAVPSLDRPDVPASLENALRQALSCEPKDRPTRPMAFARMLQGCQEELGLPVTQPVVLDVAATLNLALSPVDPTPDPLDALPPPMGSPAADLAPPPPAPGPLSRIDPPAPAAPAAPPAANSPERVFVPYTPPEEQKPESDWAAPTEPPAMDDDRPGGLLVRLPAADRSDDEPTPDAPAPADHGGPDRIRALPLVVLGLVVAIIFAAVAWSIATGKAPEDEGPGPSGSDSTQPDSTGSAPRSGLTALENANGVQLDWSEAGVTDEHLVVVLSTVQPPATRPADAGTAMLIPNGELDAASGYCFAVVPKPEASTSPSELAATIPEAQIGPDACIRNGSAATVQR